jgi:hypothetical protein
MICLAAICSLRTANFSGAVVKISRVKEIHMAWIPCVILVGGHVLHYPPDMKISEIGTIRLYNVGIELSTISVLVVLHMIRTVSLR